MKEPLITMYAYLSLPMQYVDNSFHLYMWDWPCPDVSMCQVEWETLLEKGLACFLFVTSGHVSEWILERKGRITDKWLKRSWSFITIAYHAAITNCMHVFYSLHVPFVILYSLRPMVSFTSFFYVYCDIMGIMLYKLQVCSKVIWHRFILWSDYHSKAG